MVAQLARWMGCRGRRGGDKGGAAQVGAAGSCLPLSLGSQQAALGTGSMGPELAEMHSQEEKSASLPGPSSEEKTVPGRGRLEPAEGTWGLQTAWPLSLCENTAYCDVYFQRAL